MTPIEKLSSGLWRQHFCDGQIVAFKIWDAHRATIDVWIEACLQAMYACARDGHRMRILQDLSARQFAQTPYSKTRGTELTEAFPELLGRTALLIRKGPDAQRIRLFILRDADPNTRQRQAFVEPEEALQWLIDDLETPCKASPLLWE